MVVERYISSDSHVLEPADLWVKQMDKAFRAQAPRVVHNPPGYEGDYWPFGDRVPVTAVQGFFAGASRKSYDEITDHLAKANYEERLPGSYDPAARLKDMELDGTVAEVLYPTYPLGLMTVTDAPLQRELFRVYTNWLHMFCACGLTRLVGLGVIWVGGGELAVKELQRCAPRGLKGAMIVSYPPGGYG